MARFPEGTLLLVLGRINAPPEIRGRKLVERHLTASFFSRSSCIFLVAFLYNRNPVTLVERLRDIYPVSYAGNLKTPQRQLEIPLIRPIEAPPGKTSFFASRNLVFLLAASFPCWGHPVIILTNRNYEVIFYSGIARSLAKGFD